MQMGQLRGTTIDELNIDNVMQGKSLFDFLIPKQAKKNTERQLILFTVDWHSRTPQRRKLRHTKYLSQSVNLDGLYHVSAFYMEI